MFFEDAQTGAQILNLALTARNGVPMCGLPHHASNNRDAPSFDPASQPIIRSEDEGCHKFRATDGRLV
jgi:hypothetical protein